MPVHASSVPCHFSQTAPAEPAPLLLLLWHAANAPPPSTCPRPTSTRCHWPADSQLPGARGISAQRLRPGRGGPHPLLYTTGALAFLFTPRSTFMPFSAPGSPGTNAKIGRECLGLLSQRYSHKHIVSFTEKNTLENTPLWKTFLVFSTSGTFSIFLGRDLHRGGCPTSHLQLMQTKTTKKAGEVAAHAPV